MEPIIFGLISLETDKPVLRKVVKVLNNIETSITYGCFPESPLEQIDAIEFISKVAESMELDVMNDLSDYQSC